MIGNWVIMNMFLEIFIILLVKLEHFIVIRYWGFVLTTVNYTVTVRCVMSAK